MKRRGPQSLSALAGPIRGSVVAFMGQVLACMPKGGKSALLGRGTSSHDGTCKQEGGSCGVSDEEILHAGRTPGHGDVCDPV
ncbi:hypothetical protein [Arthrobacter sp. HLT1-20]